MGGALIGAPGLTNTAITFLYLWCFEKYTEVHLEAEWNGWVLVLITSLLAYKGSLWAHDNPAGRVPVRWECVVHTWGERFRQTTTWDREDRGGALLLSISPLDK